MTGVLSALSAVAKAAIKGQGAKAATRQALRDGYEVLTVPNSSGLRTIPSDIAAELRAKLSADDYQEAILNTVQATEKKRYKSMVGKSSGSPTDDAEFRSGFGRAMLPDEKRTQVSSLPKPREQMTEADYRDWASGYGVDMGELSPLRPVTMTSGESVNIPESFATGEAPSMFDALYAQAMGMPRDRLPMDANLKIQESIAKMLDPNTSSELRGEAAAAGQRFAALSSNTPFQQNMALYNVLRPHNPEEAAQLAQLADAPKDFFTAMAREKFNLGPVAEGGLGQYSMSIGPGTKGIAQIERKLATDPDWFARFPGESAEEHLHRVVNSGTTGLSFKTGAFGSYPTNMRSTDAFPAMDIHMADMLSGQMGPELMQRLGTDKTALRAAYNAWAREQKKATPTFRTWDEATQSKRFNEYLDKYVRDKFFSQHRDVKATNPDVPEYLRQYADPKGNVSLMGDVQRKGKQFFSNDYLPEESNWLPATGKQWLGWDIQRGTTTPHEMWYPNAWKLPRMTDAELTDSAAFRGTADRLGRSSSKGSQTAGHRVLGRDVSSKYLRLLQHKTGGLVRASAALRK